MGAGFSGELVSCPNQQRGPRRNGAKLQEVDA